MENCFSRTTTLIGVDAMAKLVQSKVVILGIGGVGGAVAEALGRAGIGQITLVDHDTISDTNINRQIIALHSTIGMDKVMVMKNRLLDINPNCKVITQKTFIKETNIEEIIPRDVHYVVDAIDTVTSKLDLIAYCHKNNIKIISALGTGNKLDPTQFQIADIKKTSVCPLARVIRKELKVRGIDKLKVVYSTEVPAKVLAEDATSSSRHAPASISFVPPVAGMIIASEVVRDLINEEK